MEIDFLIIGQGLAGSALAYRLIQEGKKVVLLDQPERNQSSQVAAGLFNPVTGRKMVKTWKGELLFPAIVPFYQELEEVTGKKFLTLQPIYRPFLSIEEQNEWMGHSSDPAIQPFVQKIEVESQHENLKDPFGGVKLQHSGWLDIPTFLEGMVAYFGNRLIQEEYKEEKLLQEGSPQGKGSDILQWIGVDAVPIFFIFTFCSSQRGDLGIEAEFLATFYCEPGRFSCAFGQWKF